MFPSIWCQNSKKKSAQSIGSSKIFLSYLSRKSDRSALANGHTNIKQRNPTLNHMKPLLSLVLLGTLALPCNAQDIIPRSNGCRIETRNLITGHRSQGKWYPKEKADSLRAEIKRMNIAEPDVHHYLVCI